MAEQTEALRGGRSAGPSAKIAFDAEGNPTKAAIGFARGKGVDVDALERREEDGIGVRVRRAQHVPAARRGGASARRAGGRDHRHAPGPRSQPLGQPRRALLRARCAGFWPCSTSSVVPVEFAGLDGRRPHVRPPLPGARPARGGRRRRRWWTCCAGAFVVPSEAERERVHPRAGVRAPRRPTGLARRAAREDPAGGGEPGRVPHGHGGLLRRASSCAVPEEIIGGRHAGAPALLPAVRRRTARWPNKFLIVSNGDPALPRDHRRTATSAWCAARLYDAKFFYEEDLKHPLEAYVEGLSEVVFQEALGTTLEKTEPRREGGPPPCRAARARRRRRGRRRARGATCARPTWSRAPWWSSPASRASWAATTRRPRARRPQVAQAIADHYRPRFSGDEPARLRRGQAWWPWPTSWTPFAGSSPSGQGPTGSSDPFALRRSGHRHRVHPVRGGPGRVAALPPSTWRWSAMPTRASRSTAAAVRAAVVDFFVTRTKVMLRDEGRPPTPSTPCWPWAWRSRLELVRRVRALEAARTDARDTFDDLATAYARANNLADAALGDAGGRGAAGGGRTRPGPRRGSGRRGVPRGACGRRLRGRPGGPGGPARPHRRASSRTCWSWTRTRPCARTGCAC